MSKHITNDAMRERVFTYTKETGVSLKHIADQLSIPYSYFCGWKTGTRNFSQTRLQKVDQFLEVVNTDNDDDIVADTIHILDEALSDKGSNGSYKIMENDHRGTQIKSYNREQYLEFMINVARERLGFYSKLDN